MKAIDNLSKEKIKENIKSFKKDCKSLSRYASFDYCYNYFQERHKNGKMIDNIQLSCLQLGFYLASWGMYRGSTFLLQKSVKVFEPLIKYIASDECDAWDIDVNEYTDDNIEKLIKCGERIEKELDVHETKKATDTLVTKIMLGVFGNVPAFDNYFRLGSGLGKFNKHSLSQIKAFYETNSEIISGEAENIKTFEYNNGVKGNRIYTKAKIIDMVFFIKGLEEDSKKKDAEKLKKLENK